jgi:hypothetical protein
MRIPPSMIVMGVLTAIPFGLAIKQTLHKGPDADRDFEESFDPRRKYEREMEADRAESAARVEREARAEVERTKLQREKLERQVGDAIGDKAATLGPLFAGVELGAPSGSFQPEPARLRIQNATEYVTVDYELDASSLVAIELRFTDVAEDGCSDLSERIRGKWGAAAVWGKWTAGHQRAHLDGCLLTVGQFVDPAQWVGRGDKAIVPLDLIGKPAKQLTAKLGPTADFGDEAATWTRAGLGPLGTGTTRLSADFDHGKIVAVSATATVDDDDTAQAVVDVLKKQLGNPVEGTDGEFDLVWKRNPQIGMTTGTTITIRIGK